MVASRLALLSPKVFEEKTHAIGQWAQVPLGWWQRQPGKRHPRPDEPVGLTADEPVVLAIEGQVATVTLNRPGRRNALNLECWRALAEIAARLAADTSVRVVVLAGSGDAAFSTGSDIGEFPAERLGVPAARHYTEIYEAALDAWSRLPQPVIARLSGYCLGAALELALTADFRLATTSAVFAIPAVKLGIGISVADARRLVDVVGPAHARSILLSGERLNAERALSLGVVDDVVADEALDARVAAQVRLLLEHAPQTMAWIKRAVDFAVRHPDGEPLSFDVLGTQVFATRDCAEGMAAFLEHRPPHFQGD